MNAPAPSSQITFHDMVFGPDEESLVKEHFGAEGALGSLEERIGILGRAGRDFIARETARAVLAVIDSNLLELMGAAWKKHSKLVEVARRTSASPDSEEQVVLATHRISSVQEPQVDLLLDGVSLGTIHITVSASFEIRGLIAIVQKGTLVGLRAGSCAAEATLEIEGVQIARRETEFDLGAEFSLGDGIPLISPVDASSAALPHLET